MSKSTEIKENINEAIGKLANARDTGGDELNEKSVYFLISAVHYLPMAARALLFRSRDPVKMQKLISDPSFDISVELSCLKSVGLTLVYTLNILSFFSRLCSKLPRVLSLFSALYKVHDRLLRFRWIGKTVLATNLQELQVHPF